MRRIQQNSLLFSVLRCRNRFTKRASITSRRHLFLLLRRLRGKSLRKASEMAPAVHKIQLIIDGNCNSFHDEGPPAETARIDTRTSAFCHSSGSYNSQERERERTFFSSWAFHGDEVWRSDVFITAPYFFMYYIVALDNSPCPPLCLGRSTMVAPWEWTLFFFFFFLCRLMDAPPNLITGREFPLIMTQENLGKYI